MPLTSKLFQRAAFASPLDDLGKWVHSMKNEALNLILENLDIYWATIRALGASGFFPVRVLLSGYTAERRPVRIRFQGWSFSTSKDFVIWKPAGSTNIKLRYKVGSETRFYTIHANTNAGPEAVEYGGWLHVFFVDRDSGRLMAWALRGVWGFQPLIAGPVALGDFIPNGEVAATVFQGRVYLVYPDADNSSNLTLAWCGNPPCVWQNRWHEKTVISNMAAQPGPSAVAAYNVNGVGTPFTPQEEFLFVAGARVSDGRIAVLRVDGNHDLVGLYWMPTHYPSYSTLGPLGITVRRSAFPHLMVVGQCPDCIVHEDPRNYLYLVWKDRVDPDIYTSVLQNAHPSNKWFTIAVKTTYHGADNAGVSWAKGRDATENVRAVYINGKVGPLLGTIYEFRGYGKY